MEKKSLLEDKTIKALLKIKNGFKELESILKEYEGCYGVKTGFTKEETVLFGDRLYTDIASGVNAGISTVFVLSGEGTMKDVEESDVKPEFIYENIREIYNDLIS